MFNFNLDSEQISFLFISACAAFDLNQIEYFDVLDRSPADLEATIAYIAGFFLTEEQIDDIDCVTEMCQKISQLPCAIELKNYLDTGFQSC